MRRFHAFLLTIIISFISSTALASDRSRLHDHAYTPPVKPAPASASAPATLQNLEKTLKQQQALIAKQAAMLEVQQQRMDALDSQLTNMQDKAIGMTGVIMATTPAMQESSTDEYAIDDATSQHIRGMGPAGSEQKPSKRPKKKRRKSPPKAVGLRRKPPEPKKPPRIDAVENEGGVLLAPGNMVVETGLEYTRSSSLRVAVEGFAIIPALSIGAFEITEVDRDTVIGSLTGRLGILDNFEVSVRVPYVYRNDTTLSRPIGAASTTEELSDVSGDGIGDIEVAGRYQFTHGKGGKLGGWPIVIGNLRFKSRTGEGPFDVPLDPATGLQTELPTGSGFYALQPSVSFIVSSSPVVLYSTLGYLYNIPRDVGGTIGDIDPGDSINASFGMGFSVNEHASFSLGYSHDVVFETEQNGRTLQNSDILHIGRFLTGFGYRVNDRYSLNMNVTAGLTDDAPDMSVLFRVPVFFSL